MKKSLLLLISFYFLLSFQLSAQEAKPRAVINHIAVYVVDLANSTHFYRDIIGLDTIPEPFHDGKHTWFSIGSGAHLHLIQGAKAAMEHDKNSHLCFSVASVPDFIKVLDENKIAYENWKGEKQAVTNRVDGVKQIYITDPDGYWVEINDATE
ncbi:VOC family protein [Sinomicrobium pectinilyticum]|uniref:VOC family protein n=1 Tax=Sinomicrobium pectinilyticum TaxID=1084421 RepID=A0A3N0EUP1_SINP1|nr:VOC family protein [Sinomicrobium pectinilyticum]RNL91457.1 VOC family protein [Sinomicrobium pectinilyticum]